MALAGSLQRTTDSDIPTMPMKFCLLSYKHDYLSTYY